MSFNLYQRNYFWAKDALDVEGVDYFFDDTRGAAYLDVSVAHRTISVQHEPVLDAKFAE